MEKDGPPESGDDDNERPPHRQQEQEGEEHAQAQRGGAEGLAQNQPIASQANNPNQQTSSAASQEEVVLSKSVTYNFYYAPVYTGTVKGDVMTSKHEIKDSKFRNIEGASQTPMPTPPIRFPALGAAAQQMALPWPGQQSPMQRFGMPMLPPPCAPAALEWRGDQRPPNEQSHQPQEEPSEEQPTNIPIALPAPPAETQSQQTGDIDNGSTQAGSLSNELSQAQAPITLSSMTEESYQASTRRKTTQVQTGRPQTTAGQISISPRRIEATPEDIEHRDIHSSEPYQLSTRRKTRRAVSVGTPQDRETGSSVTPRRLKTTFESIGPNEPRPRRAGSTGSTQNQSVSNRAFSQASDEETTPKSIGTSSKDNEDVMLSDEDSFDDTTYSFADLGSEEDLDHNEDLPTIEVEPFTSGSIPEDTMLTGTLTGEQNIRDSVPSRQVGGEHESEGEASGYQRFGSEASKTSGSSDEENDSKSQRRRQRSHKKRTSPHRRRAAYFRAALSQTETAATCNTESQTNVLLKRERTIQTEEEQTYEMEVQTEKPERRNRRCQADFTTDIDTQTSSDEPSILPQPDRKIVQDFSQMAEPDVIENEIQTEEKQLSHAPTQTAIKTFAENEFQTDPKEIAQDGTQTDKTEDISSLIFPADLIAEYKKEESLISEDFRRKYKDMLDLVENSWQRIVNRSVVTDCEQLLPNVENTEAMCVKSFQDLAKLNLSKDDSSTLLSCIPKLGKMKNLGNKLKENGHSLHAIVSLYTIAKIYELNIKGDISVESISRCVCEIRIVVRSIRTGLSEKMRKIIKNTVIPLMQEMVKFLQSIKASSHKVRVKMEAWCLYRIGRCYSYCNEYHEYANLNQLGINLIRTEFKEEAQTYQIYGHCLHHAGVAHKRMGNIEKSVELYKMSLEAKANAKDFPSDKDKNQSTESTRKNLKKNEALLRK
uniref:uncharacterized protein LOC120334151 n=1 Tax=Styela clava TaxID=7725 RepID=UPI00193ACDB6|nr:uncharacterized protein LOC120334151 [Styela clava]